MGVRIQEHGTATNRHDLANQHARTEITELNVNRHKSFTRRITEEIQRSRIHTYCVCPEFRETFNCKAVANVDMHHYTQAHTSWESIDGSDWSVGVGPRPLIRVIETSCNIFYNEARL